MVDGRTNGPRRSSSESAGARRRALANEQRLLALGEAVDRRTGVARKQPRQGGKNTKRNVVIVGVSLLLVIVLVLGGGWLYANWRFGQITKVNVAGEQQAASGQPFNILSIGSDSRVGLTGSVASETGASSNQVAGQRSDSVKIIHVDPQAGTISVLSIPRDTMVSLLANQSLYGNTNRINVNFASGPSLVGQTITANWGIPLNHTVVVSFSGLMGAAQAVGGIKLNFPYPAFDPYSGLFISHTGCQLLQGYQALALSRSRHFYYNTKYKTVRWPGTNLSDSQLYAEGWIYDGSSDFGRIKRQDAFLNGLVARAKHIYNPLTLNAFISSLPKGISLDSNFTLNDLVSLALRFHGISPSSIKYYTLPTVSGYSKIVGDVLYAQQPAVQELLTKIFGSELKTPTNPPPNQTGATPLPPVIASTTTTSTTVAKKKSKATSVPVTTTTVAGADTADYFDPTPC